MSPTALSLRHLRAEGWLVDVCERWVPSAGGRVRKDLFGLIDLVALRGSETMGVQTTSHTNVAARWRKLHDDEHAAALAALMAAGWRIVVHGWRLSTRDGHACQHPNARCGCRWTLHRLIEEAPCRSASSAPSPTAGDRAATAGRTTIRTSAASWSACAPTPGPTPSASASAVTGWS